MNDPRLVITREGFAVLRDDSLGSRWIEQSGRIDYSLRVEENFRRFVSPSMTVVDVGAFVGDHAVPLAKLVGLSGRVHSFEPFEETFAALRYNVARYPQVTAYGFALGDVDGATAPIHRGDNGNVGATCLRREDEGVGLPRVRIRTLDALEIRGVSLLRMDVEGYELHVMRGAEQTIMRDRPTIVFEVSTHSSRWGVTRQDIFAWLAERGYVLEAPENPDAVQYDAVAIYKGGR